MTLLSPNLVFGVDRFFAPPSPPMTLGSSRYSIMCRQGAELSDLTRRLVDGGQAQATCSLLDGNPLFPSLIRHALIRPDMSYLNSLRYPRNPYRLSPD